MSNQIPPVAVLIAHRVADYDTWKKAFDEHQPARAEASCLGHEVHRGVDDPDTVLIYFPATDADKVTAFVDSPNLKEAMQEAGVQGQPTITLMKPMSDDTNPDTTLPGIVVTHTVDDYDTWRAAYDAFEATQKRYGILGHAVNQVLGNANKVIVYHQARDVDALRTFLASTELKEAMQGAGVTEQPNIDLIQPVDRAEY